MRTILNFEIAPLETGGGAPPGEPVVSLFQSSLGDVEPSGASSRWFRALGVALVAHLVLLAGFASAGTLAPWPSTVAAPEPEIVFYAFVAPPPPPPAAAAATGSSQPRVQARRVPRREPVLPREQPPVAPEPVQTVAQPLESPEREPIQAEETPDPEPKAVGTPAGAVGSTGGGAVGGVEGGSSNGAVGGLLGAAVPPLELSQVQRAPKVLSTARPEYPRTARLAGIEGLVQVRIVIGPDGRVETEETRIVKSVPGLDSAAIAAAHRYRFSPALGYEGHPVRVVVTLPIHFRLR